MRRRLLFSNATLLIAAYARALSANAVKGLKFGETEAREGVKASNRAVVSADEKTAAFIQALQGDAVKTGGDKVVVRLTASLG